MEQRSQNDGCGLKHPENILGTTNLKKIPFKKNQRSLSKNVDFYFSWKLRPGNIVFAFFSFF